MCISMSETCIRNRLNQRSLQILTGWGGEPGLRYAVDPWMEVVPRIIGCQYVTHQDTGATGQCIAILSCKFWVNIKNLPCCDESQSKKRWIEFIFPCKLLEPFKKKLMQYHENTKLLYSGSFHKMFIQAEIYGTHVLVSFCCPKTIWIKTNNQIPPLQKHFWNTCFYLAFHIVSPT